jgi:hypothetical protein
LQIKGEADVRRAGGASQLFPLKIDQSERLAITKSAELIAEKVRT